MRPKIRKERLSPSKFDIEGHIRPQLGQQLKIISPSWLPALELKWTEGRPTALEARLRNETPVRRGWPVIQQKALKDVDCVLAHS